VPSRFLWQKLRALAGQLPLLARAVRLAWSAAPGWSAVWLVLLSVQGLLPVFPVYLSRSVVDGVVAVLAGGPNPASLRPFLLPLALLVTVLVVGAALRSLLSLVRTAQAQLVQDSIGVMIQAQSVAVDLACYDSAEHHDRLFRVRNEAFSRPLELVESLGGLLQNTITLAAMAAVLLRFGLWAPFALTLSTLPVLFLALEHRLTQYRWRRDNTVNERRAWYCDWLLTSRENAAEIRVLGLGGYFTASFCAIREQLRRATLRLQGREAASDLVAAVFALLVAGLSLGWVAGRVAAGVLTLGELALFYQAFNQGQGLLRTLLANVGQVYGSSLFLEDFFDFLALRPSVVEPAKPSPLPPVPRQGIRFEEVTFRYPGLRGNILEQFSLTIPAGKMIAIVGMNGCGKSTLVKLLCRLYDPDRGQVTIDGIDIRDASLAELRRLVAVLFQEPVRFNLSVADNIRLGDLSRPDDEHALEQAARAAGVEELIARLPQGMATQLGRWLPDSTDLSGGEWQRIALARVLLRRAPIIVLDEPTSAMDSWSELSWLHRFRELARGLTVLVITHRFTTAMQADSIHVMESGRIVESGSHQELLSCDGRYAASWHAQVQDKAQSQ
jgi:ATP-binding cassette subfamily B protein